MEPKKLSDDQLIESILPLAIEYRNRFGKNLGITSEVGEYKAASILKLDRVTGNIQKGYDAWDISGNRVQIKTRIYHKNQERTGLFSNFVFDYALLVLLTDDYEVIEIHKVNRKDIQEQIETQNYSRSSVSIGKFKQLGGQIFP